MGEYLSSKQRNKAQHALNGNNFFSDLWSGIKSGLSSVYNVIRKPVDWISSGLNYASKIPVLGSLLAPVKGVVDTVRGGLDQAKTVGNVVEQIGLREGGMVEGKPRKMYQA